MTKKVLFKLVGAVIVAGIILYACGIVPPVSAQVTNDTVTWDAPTTRADGAPLAPSEILQYRVAWSPVAGGPYTAVTIDTAGLESAHSNEACTEKCPLGQRVNAAGACVALALPSRPINLQAS